MIRKRSQRTLPASNSQTPLQEWELYEESSPSDQDLEGTFQDDSAEEEAPEEIQPKEAEEELMCFLFERHRVGKLTAKDVCTIGHWCGLASLQSVGSLGMKFGTEFGEENEGKAFSA